MISNIHLFDEVLPLGKLHKVAVRVPPRVLHPRLVPRGPVAEALAAVETTHVVAQLWVGGRNLCCCIIYCKKRILYWILFCNAFGRSALGGGIGIVVVFFIARKE